jgi:hypothetical protein
VAAIQRLKAEFGATVAPTRPSYPALEPEDENAKCFSLLRLEKELTKSCGARRNAIGFRRATRYARGARASRSNQNLGVLLDHDMAMDRLHVFSHHAQWRRPCLSLADF